MCVPYLFTAGSSSLFLLAQWHGDEEGVAVTLMVINFLQMSLLGGEGSEVGGWSLLLLGIVKAYNW